MATALIAFEILRNTKRDVAHLSSIIFRSQISEINVSSSISRYKYNVDKILTQIQFIDAADKPLGVINWFAVHPTSMNNTNLLVSSDNVGYASILFEKMMDSDAMIGQVSVGLIHTNQETPSSLSSR